MEFRPRNKYLLVELVEEKKPEDKTSGFILPSDFKPVETHKVVKLVSASRDSSFAPSTGNLMLVPVNMLEEIKAMGQTLYLIPESAVYGVFYEQVKYD